MPEYVIYQESKKVYRAVTVINGEVWYKSSGKNSGLPDVWFRMHMLKGTKPLGGQGGSQGGKNDQGKR